jgi:hypothetical protein
VTAVAADLAFHRGCGCLFLIIIEGEYLSMKINEARKRRKKKTPYNSMSYTTGDISLNIGRFNQAMGTAEGSEVGIGGEGSLCEAKRYVRRYYIRPQNIFCSNKAEIIKALIEIDDKNCSIYTLNNLGDDKDVTKLMNSDIIYYYDDGILYDKNHVKVMDYDLSIKKEEDRKKFANVDKAPEKEFKAEYEDRMTTATELEESHDNAFNTELEGVFDNCNYDVISADYLTRGDGIIVSLNHNVPDEEEAAEHLISCLAAAGYSIIDWNTNGSNVFIFALDPKNPLDLDFDDINVYGEKLTEAKERTCCICGEPLDGAGENPEPYADEGRACSGCFAKFVLPLKSDIMGED